MVLAVLATGGVLAVARTDIVTAQKILVVVAFILALGVCVAIGIWGFLWLCQRSINAENARMRRRE